MYSKMCAYKNVLSLYIIYQMFFFAFLNINVRNYKSH